MPELAKSRPRVLVVDDEPRLTELLSLELDVEGYDVDIASDGATGLIRSRSEPAPDLIILDWNLPDFSGIDICQRIRAGGICTPILMLTGHEEVSDRVTALDAGVDDYLIKPFTIYELMARLRAMQRLCSDVPKHFPAVMNPAKRPCSSGWLTCPWTPGLETSNVPVARFSCQ